MSLLAAPVARQATPIPQRRIQRACQCGGSCDKCRKKKLQRDADGAAVAALPMPAGLDRGGTPLARPLRQRLEPLFGTGFADVRVHDDAASHQAADGLRANAFTWGQHIHFGAGRFRPDSERGLHLLAHELTHTVQQRGSAPAAAADGIEVDAPDTPMEREADASADAVVAGLHARIRTGGMAGVQAKLQRAPLNGTVERKIDEFTTISITRNLVAQRCREQAVTTATPRKKIFFWDEDAQAVGLNYSICNGKVQLETGASLDYSDVERAARDLIGRVRRDPAAGNDALRDAVNSASLSANGHITFTVSRTLEVKATSESSAGVQQQSAQVRLRVLVNTASDKVQVLVEGGAGITQDQVRKEVETFVRGQLNLGPVAIEVKFTHTDTTPGGAPGTSQNVLEGRIGTGPINVGPGTLDLGCGFTRIGNEPPVFTCGPRVTGKPDKPKKVDCFECVCPPPKPEYTCRRTVKAHDKLEREARTSIVKLLYKYDRAVPAKQDDFEGQIEGIGSMVLRGDYTVRRIDGFASPEGPNPEKTTEYNRDLSERRARHAHAAISKAIGTGAKTPLPPAIGRGELLGESSKRPGDEARNTELVAELKARLEGRSDEEKLDVLGISEAARKDPGQRRQVLADIQAFIDGKDEKGALSRRARWEKIFPPLRRVEVELYQPEIKTPVKDSDDPQACADEDKAYADARLGEIPVEQRVPLEECRR
ncbi:hypothetical protein GCM10027084_16660 [Pseudoxanthomonas sangjuensis]|uniref:eCIS core domain-containing protein n=1 Tax=Pseudoxanthomonas sangjuensis TaxID=1503750 RepID=UPI001391BFBC|nr:DUF4157 domain-containing protein [Pseudoxanthomonas sangjuensis]KAF1709697.1 hypothetical protein CSC71_10665 [Pseudoxanthomonas sangjuensis]